MEPLPASMMDDPGAHEGIGRSAMVATKVFENMGWRYAGGVGGRDLFVPEVEALAHTFSGLLKEMVDKPVQSVSTGRLMVGRDPEGDMVDLYINVGTLLRRADGSWYIH